MSNLSFPLARTGEAPIQSLGAEFGGCDEYSHRDWTITAGYLDAPDLIPAGSSSNANFDQVPEGRRIHR
jgi:hypothetical protein